MDIRRGQSGQAVKPSLELIVAQHQRHPAQYEHTKINASLCACSRAKHHARCWRTRPGSICRVDGPVVHGIWRRAREKRREQARKERSSSNTQRNEKAGCEMHGSSDGNKTACLGSGSPLAPRTKVRSPLIPLTAAVAEPNLMGRGSPVVEGRPSCGGLA